MAKFGEADDSVHLDDDDHHHDDHDKYIQSVISL